MNLKEETINEINQLPPEDLARVYDFVKMIKKKGMAFQISKKRPPYMRAREILKKCKGSLADDVIDGREERL